MRCFRILLAFWFTFSSTVFAAKLDDHQILVNTASYLSSLKSIGHMVNLMKGMANEEDKKYLNSFTKDELAQPMPEVSVDVTKKLIYIKGLQPIEVLDLAKGKFMFQGREFQFDPGMAIERAIVKLEEVIYPKKNAWLEMLLPSANAVSKQQKGMLMGVFGAMGVMGMLACMSGQQGQQGQQNQQQRQQSGNGACMMGLAGLLGMFMAMGISPDDKPKEVKCTVTMDGVRTAQIIGPNGQVLSSTQGLPGQYTTNPPLAMPMVGPPMGTQMMQICSNPTALGNINQALAAPIVLPPVNQMRSYVNAPAQFPAGGTAVRSLEPQSRKPAQSGDARFLDPAGGGSR